jgi:hypothetical protein
VKIQCIHGYFKFSETEPGQISRFSSLFGLEIERAGDHFTFSDLVEAPDYSILGDTFLDMICTKTFEGPPWEVMRENKLVYDFAKGLVVPLLSVVQVVTVTQAGHRLIAPGMILPGSVTDDGSRVTDYAAFYDWKRPGFIYSEIGYGDLA